MSGLTSRRQAESCRPRCLTCQRFVSPARCNHYIEHGDYGTVHSVEYECEHCAAARPFDQPPRGL